MNAEDKIRTGIQKIENVLSDISGECACFEKEMSALEDKIELYRKAVAFGTNMGYDAGRMLAALDSLKELGEGVYWKEEWDKPRKGESA